MTPTTTTDLATWRTFRLGRQPGLDGLRAVAILPVMAFHAGLVGGQGGYLGVDVFFVLSGFLITGLLLEELHDTGRIKLAYFYARRALRLLPALALLLVVVGAFALWRPHQVENRTAFSDILGTAFYSFNWILVRGGGRLRMLSHAWSLSIEEQFYLVWPMTLVLLSRLRVSRKAMAAVTAGGILASLTTRFVLTQGAGRSIARVNLGLDTRGGALLIGCLVAFAFVLGWIPTTARARQVLSGLGVASLVWLVWMFVGPRYTARAGLVNPARIYVEGLLLLEVATALIIAAIVIAPRSPLGQLLSLRPLVWIGRVSYALYLWHYPIDRALRPGAVTLGLAGWQLQAARLVLTLAVTTASFYLLEQPLLRLKRRFSHRAAATRPAPEYVVVEPSGLVVEPGA